MLYCGKKLEEIAKILDVDRIFYGEGRGETGICLHFPLKNYTVGTDPTEDYELMIGIANNLIDFLKNERMENWDYDSDKAGERYLVCGENPSESGIFVFNKDYETGPKIQIFLDKTFGLNEIAIGWKGQLIGDETLLQNYMDYLKNEILRIYSNKKHSENNNLEQKTF